MAETLLENSNSALVTRGSEINYQYMYLYDKLFDFSGCILKTIQVQLNMNIPLSIYFVSEDLTKIIKYHYTTGVSATNTTVINLNIDVDTDPDLKDTDKKMYLAFSSGNTYANALFSSPVVKTKKIIAWDSSKGSYYKNSGEEISRTFTDVDYGIKLELSYEVKDKNKTIIYSSNGGYFSFDKSGTLIHLPNDNLETVLNYGLNENIEYDLSSPFTKHKYVTFNTVANSFSENISEVTTGFSVYDYIGDSPTLINFTESTNEIIAETTVDPYSVYDHISENPQVIVYTETTDDITISTTTEPYDLYDEFGDEVEVLYYTDDKSVTEADLVLEANWSPIDELEGDFEIVTWTDEAQEDAQRVLELTAIPKPQFVKTVVPKRLYGYLDSVLAVDKSMTYRDEVRYLFGNQDSSKWYTWDFKQGKFVQVEVSTHDLVQKNGLNHADIKKLSKENWRAWNGEYMNIGVFLKDNARDTIVSVVESVSYQDYLPTNTSTVGNASLYILNTTAKIDIELNGNILKGFLNDDDLTRVQYRVTLNGENYFPDDGSFTKLGDSPQNIELVIGSKDIKIDDWNTLKVEFQDFFGTTDYWSTQFIGTYSGIMFKDVYGQYYSSEIGEVLQYLDFGIIIAGQTTLENEIILKNQYGYDVENIHLYANNANFPDGMTIEFSESQTPFIPQPELRLSRVLANNEEMSFFVRLKTTLGATPDANGSFDIIVKADKVQ